MRMRKRYPVAALLILLVAIALSAALVTANANALPTFNNAVNSIGPCDKCHTQAGKGVYDPDTVNIPHYPNWDGWFNK